MVMTSSTEVSHVEDTEKGFLYMSILVVHARHTDYGHPMKQTFVLGQTIWSDKFWGIWGIFKQFISTPFDTVCLFFPLINHYFFKKLNLYIEIPNIYLDWDLNLASKKLGI